MTSMEKQIDLIIETKFGVSNWDVRVRQKNWNSIMRYVEMYLQTEE